MVLCDLPAQASHSSKPASGLGSDVPWAIQERPVISCRFMPTSDAPVAISRKRRFVTLDALRGIGAVFVMAGHSGEVVHGYIPAFFQLAVDMFFVLGSFVIAYAYDGKFASGMTRREFFRARIRRFPRVCFSFFAGVALSRFHKTRPPKVKVPSILCLLAFIVFIGLRYHGGLTPIYEIFILMLFFPLLIYFGAEVFERRPAIGFSIKKFADPFLGRGRAFVTHLKAEYCERSRRTQKRRPAALEWLGSTFQ